MRAGDSGSGKCGIRDIIRGEDEGVSREPAGVNDNTRRGNSYALCPQIVAVTGAFPWRTQPNSDSWPTSSPAGASRASEPACGRAGDVIAGSGGFRLPSVDDGVGDIAHRLPLSVAGVPGFVEEPCRRFARRAAASRCNRTRISSHETWC